MTMAPNNRNYKFDFTSGNGKDSFEEHVGRMQMLCRSHAGSLTTKVTGRESFQEHNEHLSLFHKSHADVVMVNGLRCDRRALVESMPTLRVALTVSETGGSVTPIEPEDWLALVPVWKVAPRRFSPN